MKLTLNREAMMDFIESESVMYAQSKTPSGDSLCLLVDLAGTFTVVVNGSLKIPISDAGHAIDAFMSLQG